MREGRRREGWDEREGRIGREEREEDEGRRRGRERRRRKGWIMETAKRGIFRAPSVPQRNRDIGGQVQRAQ